MPRRLLSAAAAGALLLSLAACGDAGQETVTTPPPSIDIDAPSDGGGDPEPSDGGGETDEPTAATPDIPPPDPAEYAGMDEQTPEGAEQAFRYYIAVSMWAHQTGDDSLSSALETSDCGSCTAFMETFRDLQEHKEAWGEFSLSDASLETHDSKNYDFEVAYNFTTTPHKRPNDEFTNMVDVGELEYSTVGGMKWSDSGWQVGALSAEWGEDVLTP